MEENIKDPSYWSDAKEVSSDINNPSYWDDAQAVDAPNNTVFDQDNDRVVSLPQTLNAAESTFLIKRDADKVRNFLYMEETPSTFDAFSKALMAVPPVLENAAGWLLKSQGEQIQADTTIPSDDLVKTQKSVKAGIDKVSSFFGVKDLSARMQKTLDETIFNDQAMIDKGNQLSERAKTYMADSGITGEDLEGINKFVYDGTLSMGTSFAALGGAMAMRSPQLAAVPMLAYQYSNSYEEARAAKKSPEDASSIAVDVAVPNAIIEAFGIGATLNFIKGNSLVKTFFKGGLTEAGTEGIQNLNEEIVTQSEKVRVKTIGQTLQDIAYGSLVGFFGGSLTSATIGAFVKDSAVEAGVPEKVASDFGAHVQENLPTLKNQMAEFIDKELAPIAKDEKSAQEFITLMQKFGNGDMIGTRESLSPEEREVFDQYVEMFNNSKFDTRGVQDVEKKFYEGALKNGVDQEQAVAASKIVGARADAASRALGVSPMEWLESKKLEVQTPSSAKDPDIEEAKQIMESFKEARSIRNFNREDSSQVQRKLGMKEKPQSVMQFIKGLGGISTKIKEGDAKGKEASGELKRIFDGNMKSQLKNYLSKQAGNGKQSGKGLDEIYQALAEAGYIDQAADADQHQDRSDAQVVLDLIEREVNNGKIYPSDVEHALNDQEDVTTKNFDYLAQIGIDENMTEEEIAAVLRERRAGQEEFVNKLADVEDVLFQSAPKTDSEEFKKWFKKSKIVDKNGNPLVVYHGSHVTGIKSFDIEKAGSVLTSDWGKGIYFTPSKFMAEGYRDGASKEKSADVQGAWDNMEKIANSFGTDPMSVWLDKQSGKITKEQYDLVQDAEKVWRQELKKAEQSKDGEVYSVYLSIQKPLYYTYGGITEPYLAQDAMAQGHDGIIIQDEDGHIEEIVVFRSEQIKSVNNKGTFDPSDANILNQGEKNPQGQVNFGKNKTLIQLFESANPSTLLHELGHVFLRDMRDVAKVTKRPRVRADYEAAKKWLGAKGDTLTVAQEEKFARGFEAYLREGKAPKPELQSVFDTFKKWQESIYKSVQQLNVNLTPEIREVFDRMLGGDFAMAEKLNQEAAERNIEADYEKIANIKPINTLPEDTKAVFRSVSDISADAFVPVSTRLGSIHEGLKHAVRKFVFNTGLHTHDDRVIIKPFIEKVSNTFSEQDYRIFDFALKNRDTVKVDFLVDKYGVQNEWSAVRKVLDDLYLEARDVGIEVNFIEDYFPRKVIAGKAGEYMADMRNQREWSDIETAMRVADPNGKFTEEEKAEFVNSYLRGFASSRLTLARSGFTKQRTVNYIKPEFNKYYQDSMPTLMQYVSGIRHGIESRKLFGKSEKETEDNIGAYVLNLVETGVIKPDQEVLLRKLLKAVVEPTGTHGFVSWAKNASYIYLMGSPISAITQIQDLAFSLHKNGYYRTTKSLLKSLTGQQILKKEDLGIDNILREFEDETRASNYVRATFKVVGLEWMDNVGKETYINASYDRIVAAAKKGGSEFDNQMEMVFGEQAAQTKKDILDGTMSENVKYLLFSELSDVQPISLAEMPVGYLNGGNGRILYMLKTYTIKQFDIYRREVFSNLASGDLKKVGLGMRNMISLAASLMMMGMGADALKDLLLGRDIVLDDLVVDNILKIMGYSKYQIYKAKNDMIAETFFKTLFLGTANVLKEGFVPTPLNLTYDIMRDTGKIIFDDKKLQESRLLGGIPVVGKFYYWWWGGGKASQKKKSKVSSP